MISPRSAAQGTRSISICENSKQEMEKPLLSWMSWGCANIHSLQKRVYCQCHVCWLEAHKAAAVTWKHIKVKCAVLVLSPAHSQLPHINLSAFAGKWILRALHLSSVLVHAIRGVLHDSLWMALPPSADITKVLMWCVWDCFKVVKEIKAQKRIWTWAAVHCYQVSVGSI